MIIGVFSLSKVVSLDVDNLTSVVVQIAADGGQALQNVSGYETIGVEFLPALLMVLYICYGFSRFNIVVTVAYMLFRMYWGEERSGFIMITLAAIVVVMIKTGATKLRLQHAVIGIVLLAIFDFLGANRLVFREILYGRTSTASAYQTFQYNRTRANDSPLADVQEFESMSIVTSLVPEVTGGYNWFTQYATLIIRPIPRQWWENKPTYTGRIIMIKYGRFFSLTFSMMGDAYTNFGLLSVVFMMTLDSLLLCLLYKATQKTNSPYMVFLFVLTTATLPLLYRDGGWYGSMYYVISGMAGAWVLILSGGIRVVREPVKIGVVPQNRLNRISSPNLLPIRRNT